MTRLATAPIPPIAGAVVDAEPALPQHDIVTQCVAIDGWGA